MTDDQDRPEDDGYSLVVPFVACTSKGGPYDDDAFVAGFQCGEIDRTLTALAAVGGSRATFTVYASLVGQLELVAMNRGFPVVTVEECAEASEWVQVTFATSNLNMPDA